MTSTHTAIVRRAHGSPPLFAHAGTDEQSARDRAWRACVLQGVEGYRIDVVPGPWKPVAEDSRAERFAFRTAVQFAACLGVVAVIWAVLL